MSSFENNYSYVGDPVLEFKDIYRSKHNEVVNNYYDKITSDLGIDAQENKTKTKKYYSLVDEVKQLDKKARTVKGGMVTMIVIGAMFFVVALFMIWFVVDVIKNDVTGNKKSEMMVFYFLIPMFSIIGTVFISIALTIVKRKFKAIVTTKHSADSIATDIRNECYKDLEKLNDFLANNTFGIREKLIEESFPNIKFNKLLTTKSLSSIIANYGLHVHSDPETSTVAIKHGSFWGYPFIILSNIVHSWGSRTYVGTLTITWTETKYGINGKPRTVTRTQVLRAEINKPAPFWNKNTKLYFANPVCDKLSFSRRPGSIEKLSEKEFEKRIKKFESGAAKLEKEMSKNNPEFTIGNNAKFEMSFNALDRNDEVQFRELFSPDAQVQMVKLLRDNSIGFGDSFSFSKREKINIISGSFLNQDILEAGTSLLLGFDYEKMRNVFVEQNARYFKGLFFAFAPLMTIPLYQEQPTQPIDNTTTKNVYNSYAPYMQQEVILNRLVDKFKHPESETHSILKTELIESNMNFDVLGVNVFSYKKVPRIKYVPMLGRDGNIHEVPVKWIEYIRVKKSSTTTIRWATDEEEAKKTYEKKDENILTELKEELFDEVDDNKELRGVFAFFDAIVQIDD